MASYRNANLLATAQLVLAGRIRFSSIHVDNTGNSAKSYVQLYNAAAAADVTVGTTTPDKTLVVTGAGAMDFNWDPKIEFRLGLVIAATTTPGGGDAPSSGLLINLDYENWGVG